MEPAKRRYKKNSVEALLQSPYPALYKRWKAVVIPSVIVFLIIYLLQPFGISQYRGAYKLPILLGYGVVSSAALSITVYVLPALFPAYHKEQAWTLGKNLLNTLMSCLLIAIGNWLYTSWAYNVELNQRLFFISLIWVALLAPFPIIFITMWNRNLLLTRNLREATEMNHHLSGRLSEKDRVASAEQGTELEREDVYAEMLTFSGGTKDTLEVAVNEFLYAEADGNYIKVNYRSAKAGKVVRKLLRATMKQAEEVIMACPCIVRCHRAFLVNIRAVVKVDGNSQGYRLCLEGCEDDVPVSRAYAKEVKAQIESRLQR